MSPRDRPRAGDPGCGRSPRLRSSMSPGGSWRACGHCDPRAPSPRAPPGWSSVQAACGPSRRASAERQVGCQPVRPRPLDAHLAPDPFRARCRGAPQPAGGPVAVSNSAAASCSSIRASTQAFIPQSVIRADEAISGMASREARICCRPAVRWCHRRSAPFAGCFQSVSISSNCSLSRANGQVAR